MSTELETMYGIQQERTDYLRRKQEEAIERAKPATVQFKRHYYYGEPDQPINRDRLLLLLEEIS